MRLELDDSIAKHRTLEFACADADARARLAAASEAATTVTHKKLSQVWDTLGHVSVSEREKVINSIEQASITASQKALDDANACLEEYCNEERYLKRLCCVAAELMGSDNYVHLQMLAGRSADSDDEIDSEIKENDTRDPETVSNSTIEPAKIREVI